MPVTAAWIVLCPGATPSVTVADADPVSSVTAETAPSDAVPAVTVQVTVAPANRRPSEPSSRTRRGIGSWLSVSPDCVSPATARSVFGVTGPPPESPPQARASTTPPSTRGNANQLDRRIGPPLLRYHPIQDFPVPNHPELLSGHALLDGRVRLQVVRQFVERINLHPQPRHGGPLLGELAPHREPVRGAVLPAPQGEARQRHRAGEGGEAGTAHKPYRWRPG